MSDVLAFPFRNKGRIQRSRSQGAMGLWSVSQLEREGAGIPHNVVDIRGPHTSDAHVDDGRLALRLALSLFAAMSAEQKEVITNTARIIARYKRDERGA